MATTYTTNYNLGKQENHADKFDMDVLTDNADKIDAALTGLQSGIDGKQDALSSEQLAAVNSGITEEDVTQIGVNKNNISYLANNSVKNIFHRDAGIYNHSNIKFTTNADGSISLSGTANGDAVLTLSDTLDTTDDTYILYGDGFISGVFMDTYETGYTNRRTFTSSVVTNSNTKIWRLIVNSGTNVNGVTIRPMLCKKSLFDADRSYQPYAMSNAELTEEVRQIGGIKLVAHTSANSLTSLSYDTNINDFAIDGTNTDKSSGVYMIVCNNWSTTPAPYIGLLTFSGATTNHFVKTDVVTGFTPTITITENVANATITISGAAKISIYALR